MSFVARYPGRCGNCPDPIEAGVLVDYDDDRLVHDHCTRIPDYDEPRRTERACAECHLIHAGACE